MPGRWRGNAPYPGVDRTHRIIMVQVENEIGINHDTRDKSELAEKAFAAPVPAELMEYLQKHKDELHAELRKVWEAAGFKTNGTWKRYSAKGHRRTRSSWPGTTRGTSIASRRRARRNTRFPCS